MVVDISDVSVNELAGLYSRLEAFTCTHSPPKSRAVRHCQNGEIRENGLGYSFPHCWHLQTSCSAQSVAALAYPWSLVYEETGVEWVPEPAGR